MPPTTTAPTFTAGDIVARTRGIFTGKQGVVVGTGEFDAFRVDFPLGSDPRSTSRIERLLPASELKLVRRPAPAEVEVTVAVERARLTEHGTTGSHTTLLVELIDPTTAASRGHRVRCDCGTRVAVTIDPIGSAVLHSLTHRSAR